MKSTLIIQGRMRLGGAHQYTHPGLAAGSNRVSSSRAAAKAEEIVDPTDEAPATNSLAQHDQDQRATTRPARTDQRAHYRGGATDRPGPTATSGARQQIEPQQQVDHCNHKPNALITMAGVCRRA